MTLVLTQSRENGSTCTISCTGCSAVVVVPAQLGPSLVETTEPLHECGV